MENLIKELYLFKIPFSVIISEELTGEMVSVIYRDQGIKSRKLERYEIIYFNSIKDKAKIIDYGYDGCVFEYFNFKEKLDIKVRHQFIEGLNYGRK